MRTQKVILRINPATGEVVQFRSTAKAIAHLAKEQKVKRSTACCYLSRALNETRFDLADIWVQVPSEVLQFLPQIIERQTLRRFFLAFDWMGVPMDQLKKLKTQLTALVNVAERPAKKKEAA